MNDIELTILMPCLNEEKTIGFCISEAQEYIKKSGISAEILIANNGSCDKLRLIWARELKPSPSGVTVTLYAAE